MKQQKTKKEKVDHEDVFFSIRQEIITGIERIPNETARREGLFAHYNIEGSQPPIFWCFNNWAESVFLAHWLGPDQPLFAMRSLHKILEGKSNKKIHNNYLAKEYSDLLLDIYPKGPIFIGGNCQAAPISEAMAHYLTEKTGSVPFLITLEHQPFYCYPGYLLMLFGTKSEKFNPFFYGESPIAGWNQKHFSPAWGIIDGQHGGYFCAPCIHELVAYISKVMTSFIDNNVGLIGEIKLDSYSIPHSEASKVEGC
jgi:hypothetical protein